MARMLWLTKCAGIIPLVAGAGVWAAVPATRPAARASALIITTQGMTDSPEFGMLMACPTHAHGTYDEAEEKLRGRVERHQGGPSSIYICRSQQIEAVRRFGFLVDRVVLNPYVLFVSQKPAEQELYWPKVDHPVINSCRALRYESQDRQLLATLDLTGEAMLFESRAPTFEEIEWMVMAALGSGYQGIIWREAIDGHGSAGRIRRLTTQLLNNCGALATAKPVDWATAPQGQPMSALYGENALFLVLLNPQYLNLQARKDRFATAPLPLDPQDCTGQVEISLPQGLDISSACTLAGKPLAISRGAGRISLAYRLHGGGEILICALTRSVSQVRGG
ncbi:MAG: hypothetical protein NTU53_07180 [Planctomycetota bacterium]|nr:hypothetical protein [Planctomycetota bacterium]